MKPLPVLLASLALCTLPAAEPPAWTSGGQVETVAVGAAPNSSAFASRVYFAGQPSAADLAEYAKLGVKKVINLRMPAEQANLGFDEAGAVKQAGLEYTHVPFGAEGPSDDDIRRVLGVLETAGEGKILLHCASANRAGLMWTLFRGERHGLPLDRALAEGKAIGMKSPVFEKIVRERVK